MAVSLAEVRTGQVSLANAAQAEHDEGAREERDQMVLER